MSSRPFLFATLLALGIFNVLAPTSVAAASPTSSRLVLQMADGRFYDPASGRVAATEAALFPEGLSTPEVFSDAVLFTTTTVAIDATTTQITATTTDPTQVSLPDSPMSLAVQRGKTLLIDRTLLSTTKATTDQAFRPVDLAIWTPETDAIVIVRVEKKGAELRNKQTTEFAIAVRTSGALSSTYEIDSLIAPSTTPRVVAVRFPLYHEVISGKKKSYSIEEVIYSPFSADLRSPELIERGRVYLDRELARVYQDLDARNIKSVAFSDKKVTEIVPQEVAKAILLIEHVDQKSLADRPEQVIQNFYTSFGLNEQLTYAYDESQVGALGAPQFMPSTYKLLSRQTALGLNTDFTLGMRDLHNGMKAQVVYLDRLLATMPSGVRDQHLEHPLTTGAYVVAAYNAGEVRVQRAIKARGEEWDEASTTDTTKLTAEQKRLASDIQVYTAKLKTKAVKASATQTKEIKAKLTTAQARQKVVTTRLDSLKKSILRSETVHYLEKYRAALPFLIEAPTQEEATSTTATITLTAASL